MSYLKFKQTIHNILPYPHQAHDRSIYYILYERGVKVDKIIELAKRRISNGVGE